jgi:hypothetical protein
MILERVGAALGLVALVALGLVALGLVALVALGLVAAGFCDGIVAYNSAYKKLDEPGVGDYSI